MKKKLLFFGLLYGLSATSFSQVKFGSNPNTINGGSVLELESTNQGLYFPRVNLIMPLTTWGLAGIAPVGLANGGMMVYNSNAAFGSGVGLYFWNGTQWNFASNTPSWSLTGNAGTTQPAVPATYGTSTFGAAENSIGTTDAKDFTVGTDNTERMRVLDVGTGSVGVGISVPKNTLDINGSYGTNTIHVAAGASITPGANDYTIIASSNLISSATVNLPDAALCPGRIYSVFFDGAIGSKDVIINRSVLTNVIYGQGLANISLSLQPGSFILQSDGANWYATTCLPITFLNSPAINAYGKYYVNGIPFNTGNNTYTIGNPNVVPGSAFAVGFQPGLTLLQRQALTITHVEAGAAPGTFIVQVNCTACGGGIIGGFITTISF